VGAPDACRIKESGEIQSAVGYVYVYACDQNGIWSKEARLDPPVIDQSLYFGGWVSILGDTLIASMEGMNSAGCNAGALAVFRYDGSEWIFSQLLQAAQPASGDYFSYPADLSEEWIAAAANEDDDQGNNAGAVHLFQKQGTQYLHRQQLHAPVPEAGSLFGERLLIKGPWLFVSSFREHANQGAVHVFKLSGGIWNFHQTLTAPFSGAGSAFGIGLSGAGDVLAVSAPGFLFGSSTIDGSLYPWRGITLFLLEGDSWNWSRQVTECPDSSPGRRTWGYSITQLSPTMTVASIPDFQSQVNSQYLPLTGRLFMHRWPALLPDPFSTVLAGLPTSQGAPAKANGDANQNGVPNIIDWLMGQDPGAGADYWTSQVPLSTRPFLKLDTGSQGMIFMVPQLRAGISHRLVIETSTNLNDWQPALNARWEPLVETYFPLADHSRALTYFHPVFIPAEESGTHTTRFVRLSVQE
jgi:hypothetical protein